MTVGLCLHHVLCWELQARVWEPVCTLVCAHISIFPQGPCWVTVTREWMSSQAQRPVILSLTYCVTLGKLVIVSLPWVAADLPNIVWVL